MKDSFLAAFLAFCAVIALFAYVAILFQGGA